jgi:acetyl esterase/lipase
MGATITRGKGMIVRTAVTVSALALAAVALTPTTVHASAKAVATPIAKGDPTPSPSATATTPAPVTPDQPLSGTLVETVAYGPHVRQRMDVWWQPDGQRHPAVFLIHGGWWSAGDKRYMTEISRSYAEQGYTVFNINYRLSGDASWPAQRIDAIDAIATARRHAARWSFDPNRYVLVGFSAGGHIATSVGTYKNGIPGLRGVVGISPVVSPLTAFTEGAGSVDISKRKLRMAAYRLAGRCTPKKCPRIWTSMEVPLHASPGDAPMLTVHSTDEFVPPHHSEQLKERLNRAGVRMTIRTVPGIAHSAPLYRVLGVADGVQEWIGARLL